MSFELFSEFFVMEVVGGLLCCWFLGGEGRHFDAPPHHGLYHLLNLLLLFGFFLRGPAFFYVNWNINFFSLINARQYIYICIYIYKMNKKKRVSVDMTILKIMTKLFNSLTFSSDMLHFFKHKIGLRKVFEKKDVFFFKKTLLMSQAYSVYNDEVDWIL